MELTVAAGPIPSLIAAIQTDGSTGIADLLGGIELDWVRLLRAGILLFVGLPLAYAVARWVRGWVETASTPQRGLVVEKLLWYGGLASLLVAALIELGFNLAPLLGAAGIFGIALGFASQTSVSNIISGFFLMGEEPFVVGDVIQIGQTRGTVLSIDMMSVKLRTFDNRFIRIPNETLIKSEVTNITRFPIRRIDVMVGVAYKEDLGRVRELLMEVADDTPSILMEPRPQIFFDGYGESSLNLRLGVWATRENWLVVKNEIYEAIKTRFDAEDIEIPFPHRTLYAGLATEPFPVRVVDGPVPEAGAGPDAVDGIDAERGEHDGGSLGMAGTDR